MKCNTNMLFDYIDGVLDDEDTKNFQLHLESCEFCRETINTFNLMESVRDQYYDVPIDVVQIVKNSTDNELYSKKRYNFINKGLINMKKYSTAAIIALILTGSFILGEHYTLISNIKDYATSTFSNKNLKSELETYTKSLSSTPYYESFMKLIEDKHYKLVPGTISGAPIQLPSSLNDSKADAKLLKILEQGRTISIYNGLDFSSYLGKKVMLLTCITMEPNNMTRELICLIDGERPIGFWQSPSIKDDKSQLDSKVLLKGLLIDKSDSSFNNGTLKTENITPLDKLPKTYTKEMARSNGDIIYSESENSNNINLHNFLLNVERKVNSTVRITRFVGTEVTIFDLIYENGNTKIITDTTRHNSGEKVIQEFKVKEIKKEVKGNMSFYIATLDDGKSITLAYE